LTSSTRPGATTCANSGREAFKALVAANASGKHAEWLGIGIYTVRDGDFTEGWFAEDILGMLTQLDATPTPA